MSVHQLYKTRSPTKVAIGSEPPLSDGMKSDESMPHLRPSEGIYSDGQADEIKLYLKY